MISTSHVSPRARALLAKQAVLIHSRAFRIGPWSSGDSELHREARRRHRMIRYRYMESVGRKLPWEQTAKGESPINALKAAMAETIDSLTPKPNARYVSVDDVKSWSDDVSGMRPGRNIEDAERDAVNHLFRSGSPQEYDMWKSPLNNIRNFLQSKRTSKGATPEEGSGATASSSAQDASKQYTDLHKYKPVSWNEPDGLQEKTPEERSKEYKDLDKYKPVTWNEPDGLQKKTREELSKEYSDLHEYKPATWNEPDGLQRETPEELSKKYNDLDKYKPVTWNEPDGLQEKTPEELSKDYKDLHRYGPVRWNEPDGLRRQTPEERSKDYKDLDEYGPVSWNEPDGLRHLTPEEKSKKYSDLAAYEEPFDAKDSVLDEHEAKQMSPNTKGHALPAKVDVSSPEAPQYNDLHKYGPVKWNEPDGLRILTPEELSKDYEDLHLYSQYPNSGPAKPRVHPEVASKEYQDLKAYENFPNAGPETERIHPEVASKQYSDLSRYPKAGFEEPANIKHVHPEELTKFYNDLHKYEPDEFDSPDRAYPKHPEELTKAYDDLYRYNAVRHNEPDGKPAQRPDAVAASLNAYDKTTDYRKNSASATKHGRRKDKLFGDATQTSIDFTGSKTADEIRSDVLRKAKDNSEKDRLEKAKKENDQAWDAASADAQSSLKKKSGKTFTGNYAQELPQDSPRSWNTTTHSPSKSTLFLKDATERTEATASKYPAEGQEKEEVEMCSMDESFPSVEMKLQPALNRGGRRREAGRTTMSFKDMQANMDPYCKIPRGLETSYAEECSGNPTWPTFIKHHTAKEPREAEAETTEAAGTGPAKLLSYKILAYDPTMQTINIAETTSSAAAAAIHSTPADILVRLSYPSKFLPHFQSLQAQGYEIVAGSGDVLIFCKVGPGSGDGFESHRLGATAINPIDMMGRPVTGNFASPTGFVNHDALPRDMGAELEPPFRSGLHVRREEPVFSGSKAPKDKKKRRLGRKMIVGTVGLAGTAYAVGVLGEYFATGGVDGLGPKGL